MNKGAHGVADSSIYKTTLANSKFHPQDYRRHKLGAVQINPTRADGGLLMRRQRNNDLR